MKNKNTWFFYTVGSALLWSLFPIISSDALQTTPPFLTLAITLLIASVLFFVLTIITKSFTELQNLLAWKYAILTGIFIGVLHYGLYYIGLQYTSPGNAGLVALTEIGFSFLLFQIWKREFLTKKHIAGVIMLVLGAVYLLLPSTGQWNYGDLIICLSMVFAPFGNSYQKEGRKYVSAFSFLFMRCVSSALILSVLSIIAKESFTLPDIKISMPFLLINGILLMGMSKIFWLEAISRVTVTRVLALHGFVPMVTILLLWIFRDTPPTMSQIVSSIPMIIGVILLSK